MADGVLLDLDGTLVDSVHRHVVAWADALAEHGHHVPMWHIHAGIGMGGDRLLAWLLGHEPEHADDLRAAHRERFLADADRLVPTPGAQDLLADLERRGVPHVVATSASGRTREALLECLGRPDLPVTDSDDVAGSKPAPDLLVAAARQLDVDPAGAVMVGDAPWDAEASRAAGMRCIAVRTGGFPDTVLRARGAMDVVDAPRDLVGRL